MTIETATKPSELDPSFPAGSDYKSEGDNHIRLIKSVMKGTFGAVDSIANQTVMDAGVSSTALTTVDVVAAYVAAQIASALAFATGMIVAFPSTTIPSGWSECDGGALSRTDNASLFAIVGTTFGAGDGSSTFNKPNLQGKFIRGYDNGAGIDASRVFGSDQSDSYKSHTHTASTASAGDHYHTGTTSGAGGHAHTFTLGQDETQDGPFAAASTQALSTQATSSVGDHAHAFTTSTTGAHSHTVTVTASGGTETRPINVALVYCIKL